MRTETKWAVIASIAVFLWLWLEKLLGLQTAENFDTWALVDIIASIIIFTVVYYFFCREKRDVDLNGVMSWKEGFWAAGIMTLIFIPLSTLLIYIFATVINPDFIHIVAERSSGGSIVYEEVSLFLSQHTISAMVFGLLFSLTFPLFTRKTLTINPGIRKV